jgi:uncharacterized membrane protein YdfJ with MMPL/SSD domain
MSDYSLFLLSRYREELLGGSECIPAVTSMLATAGHTISVSGSTLALCFFGLCFFPGSKMTLSCQTGWCLTPGIPSHVCLIADAVSLLRTPGLGAGLTIVCVLIVNLVLTPTLLITFSGFFRTSIRKSCVAQRWFSARRTCRT